MCKVVWTAAVALLAAQLASAQPLSAPDGAITLGAAVSAARAGNPALAGSMREVDAMQGALAQADALPNPELAASVEKQESTTVQLNQPIELGGKRAARVAFATLAHDKSLAEQAGIEADLVANVVTAFNDVLLAQEALGLAREALDLAARSSAVAVRRVAAGKVSPVEETRARIAESGSRIALSQAEGALEGARIRLAATWGASTPAFARVVGALDRLPAPAPLPAMLARLDAAPVVTQSRLEAEWRAAATRVERTRAVPDLMVSIGTKRDRQLGRDQAVFGIAVPLPLFDRNQGAVREAASRAEKAQFEVAAARTGAASALAVAHARWRISLEEAGLFTSQIVPGAQSAYDAAAKGFEFGKFSFLDVLDAQRTLIDAGNKRLAAYADAHRAAADVTRILGLPAPQLQQDKP